MHTGRLSLAEAVNANFSPSDVAAGLGGVLRAVGREVLASDKRKRVPCLHDRLDSVQGASRVYSTTANACQRNAAEALFAHDTLHTVQRSHLHGTSSVHKQNWKNIVMAQIACDTQESSSQIPRLSLRFSTSAL